MQKAAGSSPAIRSKFSMNGAGLRSRESTRLGIANIATRLSGPVTASHTNVRE